MIGARHCRRGFTLIEVMIAVALLSTVALAVTSTLVSAQHARAVSEQWMQATLLATEGLEQLRAGQPAAALRTAGRFERSAVSGPWAGDPGVRRLEVTVTWNDGTAQRFQLTTLARD